MPQESFLLHCIDIVFKVVLCTTVQSHLKNRPNSNCYSNHHTKKPHHLPRQSRLFQPEAKPNCTSTLQGIQPTAQLAATAQIKQKC